MQEEASLKAMPIQKEEASLKAMPIQKEEASLGVPPDFKTAGTPSGIVLSDKSPFLPCNPMKKNR